MKIVTFLHYHTSAEIAALLTVDSALIDRMVRSSIHPPWIWKQRWREPRWESSTFQEWRKILSTIDLNSLPENPPPLQRPAEVFKQSRRGPTAKEVAVAARMCGVRACDVR